MLLGSFSFAVMGVMAHALTSSCNWPVIALARCALALLFALGLVRLHGAHLVIWKPGILWVRSLAGSVSMVCTFWSFSCLPTADVLTLTNMFPIWVALLSWPLEGEAPPPAIWVAVVSGVAGVTLIQQPHIAAGNWATLVALVSSFFTAIAMLGLHNIKGVDARAIVVHFSGVATLFAVATLFFVEPAHPAANHWSPGALLVLLAIGVTATVGQLFLTKAFSAGEPTRVSVIGLTQILFAMLLEAFVAGGSAFNLLRVLGIILVAAPTAWVMLQPRSQPVPEEAPQTPADEERPTPEMQPQPRLYQRSTVSSRG
jgi:drug/metabolite transporter (DMT)-like permease